AEVVWLQEEPANMGAWSFVRPRLDDLLLDLYGDCDRRVRYAGRPAAASPATGSAAVHTAEQEQILARALGVAADEPEVEEAAARSTNPEQPDRARKSARPDDPGRALTLGERPGPLGREARAQ